MSGELLDLLGARAGIVCLVGAGGKKSTLYRVAGLHPGRVAVTSTVFIPPFPRQLDAVRVIDRSTALVDAVTRAAADQRVVAYAQPTDKSGRLAGVDVALVPRIHAAGGFDVTLVKADGARARWIKAPSPDEPQVPPEATTVVPVVSAGVFGQPLGEAIAHRVDRISAITGARAGEPVTPEHVARLLAHRYGALKGIGDAVVVPVINMVDDAERAGLAARAAERALTLSDRFRRVLLTSMRAPVPLVSVIA